MLKGSSAKRSLTLLIYTRAKMISGFGIIIRTPYYFARLKNILLKIKKYSSLYLWLTLLVLALGVGARTIEFPEIPPGLNQDEAASAYEAYSLAETGRDKWGNKLPAYFPGWGSGQNVLLAYLTVPFIKTLGPTVFSARIVSLLIGLLTLPLFYYSVRPLGQFPALLGLLILAFCPWHLLLSRWALESNLLPFFMLLGCVTLSRALTTGRKGWIIPSLLPFSLALYAYGTTVLVLPVFFMLILLFHFPAIKQYYKQWLLAFGLFIISSFPFLLFFLENYVLKQNLAWTDHLFFATPLLPSNRVEQVGGAWWLVLKENVHFIVWGFNDTTSYNRLPGYSLLFGGAVWFAAAGVAVFWYQQYKNKWEPAARGAYVTLSVFVGWLLAATVLCFCFFLNINRFNHFYLPCLVLAVWFVAYALQSLTNNTLRELAQLVVILFIGLRSYSVVNYYFTVFPKGAIRERFNDGLQNAFAVLGELPVEQLRITNQLSLPYVYALFFSHYPPADFQRKGQYELIDGRYKVNKFGKYVFNKKYLMKGKPYGYLSGRNEFARGDQQRRRIILYTDDYWEVGIMQ